MRSKFKWIYALVIALTMQFSFAQQKTVTGTVKDERGMPIAGANVKNGDSGVATNADGKFAIKAKQGDNLTISHASFGSESVKVASASDYSVSMKSSVITGEAVFITGALGRQIKKNAVTSSVQTVGAKELNQGANPSAVQALAGKVAGLQINTAANGVNPDFGITIRGQRTITGNNQALVVIDGTISTAALLQQMPPALIEDVNVLKGAQGAALYGELGSNGVIVVTTKKGSDKKLTVILDNSVDFQRVLFLPKRQGVYGQGWVDGSYDYNFVNSSDPRNGNSQYSPFENGAWGPAFNDPAWAGTMVPVGLPQADGTVYQAPWKSLGYDNIKKFYNTGTIFQSSITLNAGSQDSYVSFNYNRTANDFVVQDDALKRNFFLVKAGKKLGKWKVDLMSSYTNQMATETDSGLLYELLQAPTNVDISLFRNSGTAHNWTVYALNPWQVIKQKRNLDNTNNFNGTLSLEYRFNKNLWVNNNANIQLNSNIYQYHNDGFSTNPEFDYSALLTSATGAEHGTYSDFGGSNNFEQSRYVIRTNSQRRIYNDLMFHADYQLTKDINLNSFIGLNLRDYYTRYTEQGGNNLKIPGWYNMQNVLNPDAITGQSNGYILSRRSAQFANADLDYKKYLFLNLTGRYEQSSLIPKKSFFYYSAGLSFILTEAFQNLGKGAMNYAKVYANYTKVGNSSSVGDYALTDVALGAPGFPYSYGGLFSYYPRRNFVDPNITPEFVYSKEVGGQFNFFKDRLTLDAAFYINDTQKMITNASTSTASGISTLLSNSGKLQNKGYELNVGITPIEMKNNGFKWNIRAGLTQYKTIVKDLSDGANEIGLLTGSSVGIFAVKGEQFPVIKTTQFATDSEGHVIVNDKGIPEISSQLSKSGYATPKYILNMSNTFSYKGISLSASADYRANYSIYSQTYNSMLFAGYTLDSTEFDRSVGYMFPNSVYNTGTATTPVYVTNPTTIAPSELATYYTRLSSVGQYSVFDASAIKIREIALAYSLPKTLLQNTGVSAVKFSLYARNPFIFFIDHNGKYGKKNQGYTDPEASTSSTVPGYSDVGQYPTTKSYGFSLNVTL